MVIGDPGSLGPVHQHVEVELWPEQGIVTIHPKLMVEMNVLEIPQR